MTLSFLQCAQKRNQVLFFLGREGYAKADFIEFHDIQQRLSGAVMEIWRAGGQAAQDWSLQPADMVELPINQRLAQIRCQYTIGVIGLPARRDLPSCV